MKGIYIIENSDIIKKGSGIGKKIYKQIELLNANGLECSPYCLKNKRDRLPRLLGRILYYLPFSNISPFWKYDPLVFDGVDFIYFRRPEVLNHACIKFFKKCIKRNKKIAIYMEIPTYPYDFEFKGLLKKINLIKDRINRRSLASILNAIFVIDPMDIARDLFGVKTIKFINGYDVKGTTSINFQENDVIDLTCVGMFNFWHGYERLFYGLKDYIEAKGNKKFHIHLIGEGSELPYYKSVVNNLKLNDYVTFYGKLFDEELDAVYSKTDIGVSCLGCFKKGISVISDLKTREYLAKGIPVLSGCTVDIFKNLSFDYYKEIENNSNKVNFFKIVEYYEFIRNNDINYHNLIKQFALDHFDFDKTFSGIITTIKENKVNIDG